MLVWYEEFAVTLVTFEDHIYIYMNLIKKKSLILFRVYLGFSHKEYPPYMFLLDGVGFWVLVLLGQRRERSESS